MVSANFPCAINESIKIGNRFLCKERVNVGSGWCQVPASLVHRKSIPTKRGALEALAGVAPCVSTVVHFGPDPPAKLKRSLDRPAHRRCLNHKTRRRWSLLLYVHTEECSHSNPLTRPDRPPALVGGYNIPSLSAPAFHRTFVGEIYRASGRYPTATTQE